MGNGYKPVALETVKTDFSILQKSSLPFFINSYSVQLYDDKIQKISIDLHAKSFVHIHQTLPYCNYKMKDRLPDLSS